MKIKGVLPKIARLYIGLFIFALGIVTTINANFGLQPWDVLHQGISINTSLTLGQASIIVGLLLLAINFYLGERIGWATIANIVFIGIFIDFIMSMEMIPIGSSFVMALVMAVIGMFLLGLGSALYIGVGLGAGPRDGIMVAFTKRTTQSVRLIRSSIEASVLVVGYLLGGTVGIGTLIMALSVGYFIQLAFKICKFNIRKIKHRYIDEDIRLIKNWMQQRKNIKIKAKE
ncbi:Uncharacterized membrane protein YczE [Natronincola peptidivorans]|uniref:Uncharacterized membrane protein YczE n=1 Tax=Natronincola peptidivorans TaxID=426128 RepID=A0A1I0D7H5_9FIRM|nr:hypothetical protein [Natronincola peptidivorans]SET28010.1 Uncharacterized membrane protein YczE [Natronincola peptidivorans]